MEFSAYANQLDPHIFQRYIDKIKLVDNVDPYMIPNKEFSLNICPSVSYIDIVNFVVYEKSAYTRETMKAFKSLEAFKYYQSGFVKPLGGKIFGSKVLLKAKVLHSMRFHEKPLNPWIIIENEGQILCAHCDCMAGLGEVCSHITAVLFHYEEQTRFNQLSTTEKAVQWKPGSNVMVLSARVCELDFGASSKVNSKLGRPIPVPNDKEVEQFLSNMNNSGNTCALMTITSPFAEKFETVSILNLSNLYSSSLENLCFNDLILKTHDVNIFVNSKDVTKVEKITRKQRMSKNWYIYRSGRITASVFKRCCVANKESPPIGLIKRICYPYKFYAKTEAIIWGQTMESSAQNVYEELYTSNHKNFSFNKNVGLHLHPMFPHFGASPDGIVSCECCGRGVVEVKCPFRLKERTLVECQELSNFFLKDFKLKKNHEYYFQVQMQIFLTESKYCDFVVWSPKEVFVQRIEPHVAFWEIHSFGATEFFKFCILPELMAHYFTRHK